MPPVLYDAFGHLVHALGFLAAGLVLGRLVLENIKGAGWQVLVPLVLGPFGLLIAVPAFPRPVRPATSRWASQPRGYGRRSQPGQSLPSRSPAAGAVLILLR
jgi:hypothetical protein